MTTRRPNTGPYIVRYRHEVRPNCFEKYSVECHTWAQACAVMRSLVIANFCDVSVSFS